MIERKTAFFKVCVSLNHAFNVYESYILKQRLKSCGSIFLKQKPEIFLPPFLAFASNNIPINIGAIRLEMYYFALDNNNLLAKRGLGCYSCWFVAVVAIKKPRCKLEWKKKDCSLTKKSVATSIHSILQDF